MTTPLPVGSLFHALLRRESGLRWRWLRVALLVAIGTMVAWMTATWRENHDPGEPTGMAVNALLHFEYTALYLAGLLAASRVMLRLQEDEAAAWLPQYVAAGMERELYALLLLVAVSVVALAEYLLLAGAFAGGVQLMTGSAVAWRQLAAVVLSSPLWLVALCALAMMCQLLTGKSTAAILLLVGVLILPFIVGVFAMLDEPAEVPLYVKLIMLTIPSPALRTTPRLLLFLFAYSSVLGVALLPLANWRVGRTA